MGFEWIATETTHGFVPHFDDAVLGWPSALPAEHAVEREGGCGGRHDFLVAGQAAGAVTPRVLVHLVVIQPPEGLV